MTHDHSAERWKHDGVRVIPGNQLDPNVPSTPGMDRKAAIRPRRGQKTVGRHGHDQARCENRRSSPRPPRKHNLCRARQGENALG